MHNVVGVGRHFDQSELRVMYLSDALFEVAFELGDDSPEIAQVHPAAVFVDHTCTSDGNPGITECSGQKVLGAEDDLRHFFATFFLRQVKVSLAAELLELTDHLEPFFRFPVKQFVVQGAFLRNSAFLDQLWCSHLINIQGLFRKQLRQGQNG